MLSAPNIPPPAPVFPAGKSGFPEGQRKKMLPYTFFLRSTLVEQLSDDCRTQTTRGARKNKCRMSGNCLGLAEY